MSQKLTVLITNHTLKTLTGTETYVRDLSLDLMRCGVSPTVFSPQTGMISHEMRRAGIPVVDDLNLLGEKPDIIHGHHTLETMCAILRFPDVPAIFVCHDASAWHDTPPKFPQIQKYIGVCQATRDRLVMSHGISPDCVDILGNAVDLSRFRTNRKLSVSPRRALVFSNYMKKKHLRQIRLACHQRHIELDAVGKKQKTSTQHPEKLLTEYDLVFAKGRCAIEAMACGAATIVCDVQGLGSLVTSANFDYLRVNNFGRRVLNSPLDAKFVGHQIDLFNAEDANAVTMRVQNECSVERLSQRLLEVYQSSISQFSAISNERTLNAAYEGTKWYMENWKQFAPSRKLFSKTGRSIKTCWRNLKMMFTSSQSGSDSVRVNADKWEESGLTTSN